MSGRSGPTRRARPAASGLALLTMLPALAGAACASIGDDFPAAPVQRLAVGETTQADVRGLFGPPWRTGMEDGERTWTYGHYRYSIFGARTARDLYLKFDDEGVLRSYTYSSTERDL